MAGYFTCYEKIKHKTKKVINPFFTSMHKKKLNNLDFTIISNNCWGGVCSEYFGLPKNSPTVGSFFFASDYIKLLGNIKYYLLSENLEMITAYESRHYEELCASNHLDVPIGKLDDIEIVFLHYSNPSVAYDKWCRRVERINWNNLIFKFSYMANCSDQDVKNFQQIKGIKKFCFVPKYFDDMEDLVFFPSRLNSDTDLGDDTFDWNRYINVYEMINKPQTGIDNMYIKK